MGETARDRATDALSELDEILASASSQRRSRREIRACIEQRLAWLASLPEHDRPGLEVRESTRASAAHGYRDPAAEETSTTVRARFRAYLVPTLAEVLVPAASFYVALPIASALAAPWLGLVALLVTTLGLVLPAVRWPHEIRLEGDELTLSVPWRRDRTLPRRLRWVDGPWRSKEVQRALFTAEPERFRGADAFLSISPSDRGALAVVELCGLFVEQRESSRSR
ncbi:MAG: hypothetical protein J0L92_07570 [Deltaproteobacteria bacterium]|nr:hypothetical protein [Deltaproteobacteria bacterium]